jgi:Concanavalin A-like lectin/glucanases superfamily
MYGSSGSTPYSLGVAVDEDAGGTNYIEFESSANTIKPGTWQHVGMVRKGNTLTMYIDGVNNGTQSAAGTANISNSSSMKVGDAACTNYDFDGLIDDVRIYNRALTAQEIKRLYNIGGTMHIGASQNQKLTNGLVGLWSFDSPDMFNGTAYDRSGQGNNGTLTNGPQRTIGKIGQGMQFDGVNDYVVLSDRAYPANYSVSVWLYFKGIVGGNESPFFNIGACYSTIDNDGTLSYWNNGFAGSGSFGGGAFPIGSWQQVVVTYDGTVLRAYVNGSSFGNTITSTSECTGASNVFEIGASSAESEFFNGLLDDVRIYNRVLTAQEIKRLYNMGHTN